MATKSVHGWTKTRTLEARGLPRWPAPLKTPEKTGSCPLPESMQISQFDADKTAESCYQTAGHRHFRREANDGCSRFPGVDRRHVRAGQKAARRETVPSGADARAAVSLQPGVRRLRQDSVP